MRASPGESLTLRAVVTLTQGEPAWNGGAFAERI